MEVGGWVGFGVEDDDDAKVGAFCAGFRGDGVNAGDELPAVGVGGGIEPVAAGFSSDVAVVVEEEEAPDLARNME